MGSAGAGGLLNILKPPGMTSHDVVAQVRRRLPRRVRVGHAGTLDPAAAGVLLVLVGRATRLSQYLTQLPKTYRAVVQFGRETDTGDGEGATVSAVPAGHLTAAMVQKLLPKFTGEITQIPPTTSAIKVDGETLYSRVRRGENVTAPPRQVHIHQLSLLRWYDHRRWPQAMLDVHCSAGTYIRSLARDLGQLAGTGGFLRFLLRLAVDSHGVDSALTLAELPQTADDPAWSAVLLPPADAVAFLPAVILDRAAASGVTYGRQPPTRPVATFAPDVRQAPHVRLLDESGRLLAVGRPRTEQRRGQSFITWQPRHVMLRPEEVNR